MKRKTNKAKEEAWSQTAHAPDGEQPGPEASDTSVLFRIRNNQDYAEEIVIPKLLHQVP